MMLSALLGVKGYGKEPKSIPVGYETAFAAVYYSIKECFQSIPKQLSRKNKKFQYAVIKTGSTASKYMGSLQWIEDAGIISWCYNLSITELPLDGNAIEDVFKVYMKACGLFISMLGMVHSTMFCRASYMDIEVNVHWQK